MIFSKSFGYALRAVLYVALMSDEKKRVQVDEIAQNISVPKHFLGKIMNRLVKEGLLASTKGPYGGFSINRETLLSPLAKFVSLTGDMAQFNTCILRMDNCNSSKPCPLHSRIEPARIELMRILKETTIKDLLHPDKKNLVKSITTT
jgi:Rrf2 family transcriptional regulator, iron-sulfur cluster assembly transcription factor